MLYDVSRPPTALYPGDYKYLFGTSYVVATGPTPGQIQPPTDANGVYENLTAPIAAAGVAASIAAQLVPSSGRVPGAMVQLVWPADPGAFTCLVQEAAINQEGMFLLPTGSAAYTINAATAMADGTGRYTAWAQFQPDSGMLLRLKFTALPGSKLVLGKLLYV